MSCLCPTLGKIVRTNSQIGELFAVLGKNAHFEKKVPNFGEKDRFFLTIFPSICVQSFYSCKE